MQKKIFMVKVLIKKLDKDLELPNYKTIGSSGLDLKASIKKPINIKPKEKEIISTGISVAIPVEYEIQIRPRSGLSAKNNISVLNTPGTIDADYRGEIGVILVNLSDVDFLIENGERVAQMVIAKHEQAQWVEAESLAETDRGAGGFGSTGVK